ncbi:MAG TPA: hypothetical protein VN493_20970 [Thermoanaerobaculia bacterium]|nr:hypothetical protein [Thermoanaerobaculia bacterium]
MKMEQENRLQEGLRQLARETRPAKPLPSAEQIWWRAEVIRRLVSREEAARRAERPLLWSQAAGFVLVLVGLLSFFVSQEPRFLAILIAVGLTPLTVLLAFFFLRRET